MPGWLSTLGVCSLPHLLGAGGLLAELPGSPSGPQTSSPFCCAHTSRRARLLSMAPSGDAGCSLTPRSPSAAGMGCLGSVIMLSPHCLSHRSVCTGRRENAMRPELAEAPSSGAAYVGGRPLGPGPWTCTPSWADTRLVPQRPRQPRSRAQ